MSYRTSHQLICVQGDVEEQEIVRFVQEEYGPYPGHPSPDWHDVLNRHPTEWRERDRHLREISRNWPHAVFALDLQGEDEVEISREYHRNGASYARHWEAPGFDPSRLGETGEDAGETAPRVRQTALRWLLDHRTRDAPRNILRAALTGERPEHASVPISVQEFQECVRVIDAIPQAREGVSALAGVNRYWRNLDRDWAIIEEQLRTECGTERMPPHWDPDLSPTHATLRESLLSGTGP